MMLMLLLLGCVGAKDETQCRDLCVAAGGSYKDAVLSPRLGTSVVTCTCSWAWPQSFESDNAQ